MAAQPTLEPTVTQQEEQEEIDDGEESDVYEVEGEEEGDFYEQEEDEDEDGEERAVEGSQESMTALLLGKQNGTIRTEVDGEVDDEVDDEEDDEYHEDVEGTAENPIDLSSALAGSKRGVEELSEKDVYSEEDDGEAEETVAKKAKV